MERIMKKILLLATMLLQLTSCVSLENNYSKDNPILDAYIRKELILPRYDFSKKEYFYVYDNERWIEPEYVGTDRGGYLSFNYHFDDESLFEAIRSSSGFSTYYPLFKKMQANPVETHMSVDVTSSSFKYKNTFDSTIIIPKYYTAIARSWDSFCEQNNIFNVFKAEKDAQSTTVIIKKSDVDGFRFYRHYAYGTHKMTDTCDLKLDEKIITYSYKQYPRNSDTVTDSQEFVYSFGTSAYLDGFEGGRININSNFDASTYYFSHYDLNAGYPAYCAYNVFKAFNEMAKAKDDCENITHLT